MHHHLIYLSIYLSIYTKSIHTSIHQYINTSIQSIHLYINTSIHLSIHLYIYRIKNKMSSFSPKDAQTLRTKGNEAFKKKDYVTVRVSFVSISYFFLCYEEHRRNDRLKKSIRKRSNVSRNRTIRSSSFIFFFRIVQLFI